MPERREDFKRNNAFSINDFYGQSLTQEALHKGYWNLHDHKSPRCQQLIVVTENAIY